jgi:hypothetical protein
MSTQQFIDAIHNNDYQTYENIFKKNPSIINEVNKQNDKFLYDIISSPLISPSISEKQKLLKFLHEGGNFKEILNSLKEPVCSETIIFLIKNGIILPQNIDLFKYAKRYDDSDDHSMIEVLYERKIDKLLNEHQTILADQKQYYENLLQQKLAEQKAQLLEEMYAPKGIGYNAAKERFES